jgi:glycosyltransferase involved in cell wall biosynthesis
LRRLSVGVVYTVHNLLPHDREHDPAVVAHYRRLYHRVDHLVVHAGFQQQQLQERFGIAPERITVIPHGPLFHRLQLPPRREAAARLGLKGPGPYLLHFGHMRPYKGTELLLAALPTVLQRHPQAVLLLAGPATAARRRALEDHITACGLKGHVQAHFGYLPTAVLADYFALADVVVLPYRHIDQSGVLLSALGLGLPVIASDCGGVSETIRAQDLGYLTPVGDAEALAATILAVLADGEEAWAKARRARAYVCTELGWSRIAAETVALYRRLLS